MPDTIAVGDVLDRIPTGPAHRAVLLVTGAAWGFAAMEVLLITFTLPVMTETWGLSGSAAGLLGSASLAGMVVGSWLGGTLADRHGRRTTLQAMIAGYAIASGLTALAGGFEVTLALRVVTGVGIGGTATAATVYLSEHLPTANRGSYLTYLDAFWAIGTIAAVLAAWVLLGDLLPFSTPVGFSDWRLLFAIGTLPILLVPVLQRFEESPYYLVQQGDTTGTRRRIQALANGDASLGLDRSRLVVSAHPEGEPAERGGLNQLFAPALRRRTAVVVLAWFGANLGFYGVFIWLPDTVGAASLVGGTYQYLLLAGLVQIPGYLSAAALVDRVGPRLTLGTYLLGSGIATSVFAAALPGVTPGVLSGFWPFLLGLLAVSFFSVGAFGALRAYTPSLFPTAVRSTGGGVAEGVGRGAGILGPVVAGSLVSAGYVVALAPLVAGFLIAGVVVLTLGATTHGAVLD